METITIHDRTYPVVALLCPSIEDTESDWDRSLGAEGDSAVYIPSENGLLFEVTVQDNKLLQLNLYCVTCEETWHAGEPCWLPIGVGLLDGELVPGGRGLGMWLNAEPDWVAETIDRLSRLPFTIPDGPRADMTATSKVVKP